MVAGRLAFPATSVAALALAATLLAQGCGSGSTKTVSVSSSPAATLTTSTAPSRSSTTSTAPQTTTTATAQTTTNGTGGAQATRTSTAPAFTKHEAGGSEGLQQALAVIQAHGFTAKETSDYRDGQTLRVLVGTRSGSSDGLGQQAFFFLDGRYLGTDASSPSASVKVVDQSDTEVTLGYPLYKAHDPLCCPAGGEAKVRFQLNNGHLVALDPIPPVSSQTGLSRQ